MNPYWAALVALLVFHVVAAAARRGEKPRRGRAFLIGLAFLPATFIGIAILLGILFAQNTPTQPGEATLLGLVVALGAIGLAFVLLLWRWSSAIPIIVFSGLLTWSLLSLMAPLPSRMAFNPLAASSLLLMASLVLPHGFVRVMNGAVRHRLSSLTVGAILLGPAIIFAPFGSFFALGSGATGSYTEAFRLELDPDDESVGFALAIPIAPAAPTPEGRRLNGILLENARVKTGDARLESTNDGRLRVIGQGRVTVVSSIEYYGSEPGERVHGRAWGPTPVTLLAVQPLRLDVHWSLKVGPSWYGCTFTGAESRFSLSQEGELAAAGSALPYVCV